MKAIKKSIYNKLLNITESKIKNLQNDINSKIISRDSDTKSSAGDKHETSRAKIQIEIDQLYKQLFNLNQRIQVLSKIEIKKKFKSVGLGSLVHTNIGIYFIAIGHGQISFEKNKYYAISLASPLGLKLRDKFVGDEFTFNSSNYRVIKIY